MTVKNLSWSNIGAIAGILTAIGLIAVKYAGNQDNTALLNVSYDATRELYQEIDRQFAGDYEKRTGKRMIIRQSHGGSARQARAVINGELKADIVTLGLPSDVEALHKHGLLADRWAARLPNGSKPYSSTIVFVVRRGNPKGIRDWPDLIGPGVEVITPDPQTSDNGKLSVLAAWSAIATRGGSDAQARIYLKALYAHAPFLPLAARDAGIVFAIENIGDVHLAWENEALLETDESHGALEIVYPPVSILAEPAVAWVDSNVAANGSAEQSRAYLEFLYSEQAQETLARYGYRPLNAEILKRHVARLPPIELIPVTRFARDWDDAYQRFFAEHGVIDTIYQPKPR
jgi:sulfate/thiosulfate transport system substrate-binding protein